MNFVADSRPEGTDFEVMHVNKINENDVDLSLQSFTYVHNEEDVLEGKFSCKSAMYASCMFKFEFICWSKIIWFQMELFHV